MEVVTRSIILYVLSVLLFRLMGKGLTFQQKPYDFAVIILIGSAAGSLIVNRDVPLLNAVVAMVVLALLHALVSVSTLNNFLKSIVGGKPDLLVRNGRIVKENLIKNQINISQLLASLRNKGYRRISDVEFAILEANGQLSVIPKSQFRPVTPVDLQLDTSYEGIATPLIIEGQIVKENLRSLGLDNKWLMDELSQRKLKGADQVLLALLDTDGSIYVAEQPPLNVVKSFFLGEGKDTSQGKVS